MDLHFKNCTELEKVKVPYTQQEWDLMDVKLQQKTYAEILSKQVNKLQGNRFAIVCMGRVSFYNTLEDARSVMIDLNKMFSATLYYPIQVNRVA
jgi:hypothetical protein